MTAPPQPRVVVLGAESGRGRDCAGALAAAGCRLALVSARPDAEAAFAVQRLARKLAALSQAIDAANEAAVRVMLRQVSKEMGGLDAVVVCADDPAVIASAERLARREMGRTGGGVFIGGPELSPDEVVQAVARPGETQ